MPVFVFFYLTQLLLPALTITNAAPCCVWCFIVRIKMKKLIVASAALLAATMMTGEASAAGCYHRVYRGCGCGGCVHYVPVRTCGCCCGGGGFFGIF